MISINKLLSACQFPRDGNVFKFDLILEFYNTLDPVFTKEYFLSLRNNDPVDHKLTTILDEDMFPSEWLMKPIYATAEALTKEEAEPCMKIMVKAMKKYPEYFIKDNINKIYIVKNLKFYKKYSYNTFSLYDLYFIYDPESGQAAEKRMERHFHTEFSRLLQYKYKYLINDERKNEWKAANPAGFMYDQENEEGLTASGVDKENNNEELASASIYELYNHGFLHKDALRSIYSDFTFYVIHLFMSPKEFINLAKNYPMIEKKMNIVINGYSLIDPAFTYDHFLKL